MGKGQATVLVAARKDPYSGNLDRIQIVKGWLDKEGKTKEKVYDAVWSDADKRQLGADGKLPPGARPQLSIDGTVEITRLPDVLYTGKPAYGQSNQQVGLFKVVEDGEYAVRTNVQLGLGSVNLIEIIQGLNEGDEVILSDMSRWDSVDRVRLR